MRVLKDIPHDRYKIQIMSYNAKYIVKIELGQFEQIFKIGEIDVYSIEEVENMLTKELLSNSLKRFIEMRSDWEMAFNQKNTKN
ncbi:MAG: hypothetical protein ACK457_04850 [Flavobacteriia bacterium]|jgi:hypothetical protein|nr:hypothetical protein [Cryomorphaceae bacterium]